MIPLLVATALVILASVTIVASVLVRRNDTHSAVGRLSRETRNRDVTTISAASVTESAVQLRSSDSVAAAAVEARLVRDNEATGIARRQFLNRSIVAAFGIGLAAFGSTTLAFLWPRPSAGFGSKLNLGHVETLQSAIRDGGGFHYVPNGRLWVTEYPPTSIEAAQASYSFFSQVEPGLRAGVTALYQVCPHLGCRVPECRSSQWFECPCHGSKYNRVGEKKAGPAPRGLDRFPMTINSDGDLIVDTGSRILGPPIGTNTTGQEAQGPACVSIAIDHV